MEKFESLVAKAQEGDDVAFEKLISLKRREILYIAFLFSRNATDAEDYAQEAVVNAYKNIQSLKNVDSFNSWLYGVIKNTCNYGERKKMRHKTIPIIGQVAGRNAQVIEEKREEFLPVKYVESKEKRLLILRLINSLKDNYRECIFLYYFEGLSYEDMAQILGVEQKKIANDLARAKESLKKMIERSVGESLTFSALPLGAVPVLTRIYQSDYASSITPEMGDRLADFAHALTGGSVSLAAATGAAVSGKVASVAGAAVSTKIALGVSSFAALVLCAGVACFVAQENLLNPPEKPEQSEMSFPEEASIGTHSLVSQEVSPEEAPITSLADMIGADNELLLLAYEQAPPDAATWKSFLFTLGVKEESYAIAPDGQGCFLYVLEKQDKQFLLAEYRSADGSPLKILHLFRKTESIPDIMEFILMFDG